MGVCPWVCECGCVWGGDACVCERVCVCAAELRLGAGLFEGGCLFLASATAARAMPQ